MELLAPAGSFSALCAAVQSGADAVYIGGSEFSARRSAANFTLDEIKKAADYCHVRGVTLHVAANILIKEKEKEKFLDYIGKLNEIGVDAVIIQDIGMAAAVHRIYPDLPIHASTQMTAASVDAAKKLKEIGFSRVVLARELSCEAIRKICSEAGVETEVFAHGAICMSYSGQCLMSSIIGGRSGNRGMCAQPCRLPYKIEEKSGYLLSPKDLCMIERLSELKEIGVTSLKIEGRLKRSEYVAAVSGIYRKYIDEPKKVSSSDMQELFDAFSRSGFTCGYFDDRMGSGMMSYKNPANAAENIFSDEVKRRCTEGANFRKTEIFMSAALKKGKPLSISVWDDKGNFAECVSDAAAEAAINRPLDRERLLKQLLKLGDTPFFVKEPEIELDEGITIAISEINSVRRRAVEKLIHEKCKIPKRRDLSAEERKTREKAKQAQGTILTAQVTTYEQAKACIDAGICEIYADTPLANKLLSEYKGVNIIAKLPPVARDDREYEMPKTDAVLISNIGQLDEKKRCYGDFRLNIFNSESVEFYSALERVTMSPELNLKELSGISEGSEVIAYGRIPLMVMENCPLKALGKCQSHKLRHSITDRKNEAFPLKCNEGCVLEILNSKPIFMADKLEFVNKLKISALRLIFTVENSAECDKIVNIYKMALLGQKVNMPEENTFTRGHFYRGTE
ncbi:MAG: U32 family peptidase [Clostridia bacterium]|nr:U32 family peptidase [Clostridia bacterium]